MLKFILSWCSLVLRGGRLILPVPCVSYEVMVKPPCLWQKEIYHYLNWLGLGFGVVLGFLQAPVLIWTCLRQQTQLIVAFLCKAPQNQHCFLIRRQQLQPLTASLANHPIPGHSWSEQTRPCCHPAWSPWGKRWAPLTSLYPCLLLLFQKPFLLDRNLSSFVDSCGAELGSSHPVRWFIWEWR